MKSEQPNSRTPNETPHTPYSKASSCVKTQTQRQLLNLETWSSYRVSNLGPQSGQPPATATVCREGGSKVCSFCRSGRTGNSPTPCQRGNLYSPQWAELVLLSLYCLLEGRVMRSPSTLIRKSINYLIIMNYYIIFNNIKLFLNVINIDVPSRSRRQSSSGPKQ